MRTRKINKNKSKNKGKGRAAPEEDLIGDIEMSDGSETTVRDLRKAMEASRIKGPGEDSDEDCYEVLSESSGAVFEGIDRTTPLSQFMHPPRSFHANLTRMKLFAKLDTWCAEWK